MTLYAFIPYLALGQSSSQANNLRTFAKGFYALFVIDPEITTFFENIETLKFKLC